MDGTNTHISAVMCCIPWVPFGDAKVSLTLRVHWEVFHGFPDLFCWSGGSPPASLLFFEQYWMLVSPMHVHHGEQAPPLLPSVYVTVTLMFSLGGFRGSLIKELYYSHRDFFIVMRTLMHVNHWDFTPSKWIISENNVDINLNTNHHNVQSQKLAGSHLQTWQSNSFFPPLTKSR